MRIATWNINSVRLRLDLVLRLAQQYAPDVICLQETKVINELFPVEAFEAQGYAYRHLHGMKGYNGVAILSKVPLRDCGVQDWCGKADCRHAFATLPSGVEVHCLYIPSGGDIPDPEQNEKFAHKLCFVNEMTSWWGRARGSSRPMVAVGDFNIAPLEHDVWNHKALLDVVSHTPVEVEALTRFRESIGWVDVSRRFVSETKKLYTWWSYRAKDWDVSDRGRRLDHVWVTQPLANSLISHEILREARGWDPKPSDHVPVVVDLDI